MSEYIVIGTIIAAFAVAAVLSYFFTPPVKNFAHKVGAIDVPKDARRMHKKPIPRLGGLAIYGGFLCSILIFGQLDETMLCVLLGAAIIVALGIFDDVLALGAKLKFVVQIVAAAIPVCIGDLQIGLFTNLNPLSDTPFVHLGILAVPVTIIWIVGITNAVNLIDGLDGLAVGVSSIAAITMLAVALLTGNMPIAITMAALAGACIGFMPYNLNPAKIFMGDTGSTFLGYMLAKEYGCESVAFPLISSGIFGYPKDQALKVAIDTISSFLLENEMTVYIVIFDRKAYQISGKLFADIASYIDDRYVDEHTDSRSERLRRMSAFRMEEPMPCESSVCDEAIEKLTAPMAVSSEKAATLDDALEQIDESFSEMLLRKIDERGMTDAQCYKKANIDRKLFSKIRSDKSYKPSKPTVIAFSIALELPLTEMKDMLMKAGFALSHSNKFDIIVEYFVEHGNYNIFEINEALFAFDQSLIGA